MHFETLKAREIIPINAEMDPIRPSIRKPKSK